MKIKKLGILTSGGDCPGLNAIIRAIALHAIKNYDCEIYGILDGTEGFMSSPVRYVKIDETIEDFYMMIRGGTFLGTISRSSAGLAEGTIEMEEVCNRVVKGIEELGIDALIPIGGDGSMRIIQKILSKTNIPFIGVPKTIDNDVGENLLAVGYTSALDIAVSSLDKLQTTGMSHKRIMILELMGRDAGHIALNTGIAGCADVILIPEIPYVPEKLLQDVKKAYDRKGYAIVVTSEAATSKDGFQVYEKRKNELKLYGGIGHYLEGFFMENLNIQARSTTLGHLQRGGQPIFVDRILATVLGVKAVEYLFAGETEKIVCLGINGVKAKDINLVVSKNNHLNPNSEMIKIARSVGISFADE